MIRIILILECDILLVFKIDKAPTSNNKFFFSDSIKVIFYFRIRIFELCIIRTFSRSLRIRISERHHTRKTCKYSHYLKRKPAKTLFGPLKIKTKTNSEIFQNIKVTSKTGEDAIDSMQKQR